MKTIKIGVDATALVAKPTGVGNYISALLAPMVAAHPEAEFILFSNCDVFFPSFANVRTCISQPRRRGPYWQNTHLRAMLTKERPQVFWATNGLLPLWGISGIARVLTVHDLVYKFAPETLPFTSLWGRRIGQRLAVAVADKVVYVSHATATDAEAAYGRKADAIIPPLVDRAFKRPPEFALTDMRLRLKLPERYLLALGTLEPRKNLVSLIDAYLKCRESGVALPLLAIAGGKGWLDNDIATRLEQGEALGFVRRLGYVDLADLPALYAACEAFVMPSLYEGFGMPLLEAQLCGAAVIHGPHASMREAAGNLGCITPTDVAGVESMLDALSQGRLPVACRLPGDIVNDAKASADRLWELLMSAAREKAGITA
jgi:glycosyltransferase involved in cell wall biosynthesis